MKVFLVTWHITSTLLLYILQKVYKSGDSDFTEIVGKYVYLMVKTENILSHKYTEINA
jgi:hypothetical protein